jgi:hypothetical protein
MDAARIIACPPHHAFHQTLVGLTEMTGVRWSSIYGLPYEGLQRVISAVLQGDRDKIAGLAANIS